MKKLFLAASFCLLGSIAAKAQWFVNYTGCDVTIQQICVDKFCVATPGTPVLVTAGNTVPAPAFCTAPLETTYQVCWVSCPGTCATVTVSTTPYKCPTELPFEAPLGACSPCGPSLVSADPSGTVKIFP